MTTKEQPSTTLQLGGILAENGLIAGGFPRQKWDIYLCCGRVTAHRSRREPYSAIFPSSSCSQIDGGISTKECQKEKESEQDETLGEEQGRHEEKNKADESALNDVSTRGWIYGKPQLFRADTTPQEAARGYSFSWDRQQQQQHLKVC